MTTEKDETVCADDDLSGRTRIHERGITRKLDLRILLILFLLYLFSAIDKTNISNAKLGGLEKDLGLTPLQYRWCLSIVYAGMVLFQIPSNIILRRWRSNIWVGVMAISWGGITMCMAATTNFAGLFICRLLMGVFEAGYFPAAEYVMATWYTRREYGRRVSVFWASNPFAYAIGGLIAFGVSQIPTERLNTWNWIFLLEGIPSVLLGVVALWSLPSRPADPNFLKEDQLKHQIQRFADDQGSMNYDKKYLWKDTVPVLKDWKPYMYAFIVIVSIAAGVGFGLSMPSIVHGLGNWSPAVSQALTAPPNLLACIASITAGYSSDRFLDRSIHGFIFTILTLVGLFMLIFLPEDQLAARYFAVCFTSSMSNASAAVLVSWSASNFGALTRRALAIAIIGCIGQLGGVIGPQFYFDEPRYLYGYTIAACMLAAKSITILVLRSLLARENKKRSEMTQEERLHIIEKYNLQETGDDRHPDFRFLL